ncbi:ABC transporter permease [Enterococcus sp. HY326]|uniref:ABC transporter permease n=1 Tax=Enterococcus sp. HY326 TaxID=2971265 RepID=UPI00223EBBF3|nr:ABC transporter permease [Enterococcus sp. HY326]
MIAHWVNFHGRLTTALVQHLQLVLFSLAVALVAASLLLLFFSAKPKWLTTFIYFFSALYAVPSYAFFALLIPVTGLGTITAIIVLSLYSEYILLRTFVTSIQQIDPLLLEAATGMGMTEKQVFKKIQLPLAARGIFSGIRLALTSIIGIATIAATINAGGLGTILFDGLRTQSLIKIVWGTLLTILLCLLSSGILKIIEYITIKKLALEEI